jgi:hypothetical protein
VASLKGGYRVRGELVAIGTLSRTRSGEYYTCRPAGGTSRKSCSVVTEFAGESGGTPSDNGASRKSCSVVTEGVLWSLGLERDYVLWPLEVPCYLV